MIVSSPVKPLTFVGLIAARIDPSDGRYHGVTASATCTIDQCP